MSNRKIVSLAILSSLFCIGFTPSAEASFSCSESPDPVGFVVGNGASSKCPTDCQTMAEPNQGLCKTANAHAGARSDQIYNTLLTPEMGCNVSDPMPLFFPTCISNERIFHRKMTSNNCVMPELANDNPEQRALPYQEQRDVMIHLTWGNLIEQTKSVCNFRVSDHVVPGSSRSGFPDVHFIRLDSPNGECKILASKDEACPAGYAKKPRSITYQGDTSHGTVIFSTPYTMCKVMNICVKK